MVQPIGSPLPYDAFRSGLTFAEVRHGLRAEANQVFEQEGRRMFVTRRTVLGRMMQYKRAAYADYRAWHRPAVSWE